MDSIQLANIKRISEASKSNRLVVFVGAGVSMNSEIPSWNELIQALKKELPSNLKDETDDLKTAQLYKDSRGHKEYIDKIKKELKYGKASFNPIHEAILNLNPCHIITTNYDDLLEQALRSSDKQYQLIRKDEDLPHTQYANMLIKMHGDFETNNIVLTENDYYNYKDNFPLINAFVQSLFATNLILFVGFSFNDMNLKIILNSLKKLLKNDFQPVYLLSNKAADNAHISYFKNKGVNVTWLSDEQLKEIPENNEFVVNINKIPIKEGKQLYKQLEYIKDYSKGILTSFDLIDALYEEALFLRKELPYIATGLKYIWPEKEILSTCIIRDKTIFSNKLFNICKRATTFKGKKDLIIAKGEKLNILKRLAWINDIYYVGNSDKEKIQLFSEEFERSKDKYYKKNCIDLIYEFNYKEISEIKRNKELDTFLKFSNEDLELGYAYYMLGKYSDANLLYREKINSYWETKNHILYFICKNNINALSEKSNNENLTKSFNQLMSEEWNNDVSNISYTTNDLESILQKCNINNSIKKLLSDLISNHYFLSFLEEITTLTDAAHDARQHSEKGGYNSMTTLPPIKQIFKFNTTNYIINFDSLYYKTTFIKGIGIVLDAHIASTTQKNNNNNSHIKCVCNEIDKEYLIIMIFAITFEKLKQIFIRHKISSITLSTEAVSYMNEAIKNIHEQYTYIKTMSKESLFIDRLNKIIFLALKSENEIENAQQLFMIARSYKLKSSTTSEILACLSKKLERSKVELSVTNVEQLNMPETFTIDDIDNIAYYYPIVNDNMKEEIRKRIKPELIDKCETCAELVLKYNIPIFNSKTLTVFIEEIKNIGNPIIIEYCIYSIYRIFQTIDNQDMKNIILEYTKESDFLAFLMSPKQYNKNNINIKWLHYCKNEDLKYFLSDTIWKEKLKQYAIESKDNSFKDKIWNLL